MYNSALDILGQLFIRFTLTLLTSFETLDIYIYTKLQTACPVYTEP